MQILKTKMTPEQRIFAAQEAYAYPYNKPSVPRQFSSHEEYEEAKKIYWEYVNISNISPRNIKNTYFAGEGKNELLRKFNSYVNEKI